MCWGRPVAYCFGPKSRSFGPKEMLRGALGALRGARVAERAGAEASKESWPARAVCCCAWTVRGMCIELEACEDSEGGPMCWDRCINPPHGARGVAVPPYALFTSTERPPLFLFTLALDGSTNSDGRGRPSDDDLAAADGSADMSEDTERPLILSALLLIAPLLITIDSSGGRDVWASRTRPREASRDDRGSRGVEASDRVEGSVLTAVLTVLPDGAMETASDSDRMEVTSKSSLWVCDFVPRPELRGVVEWLSAGAPTRPSSDEQLAADVWLARLRPSAWSRGVWLRLEGLGARMRCSFSIFIGEVFDFRSRGVEQAAGAECSLVGRESGSGWEMSSTCRTVRSCGSTTMLCNGSPPPKQPMHQNLECAVGRSPLLLSGGGSSPAEESRKATRADVSACRRAGSVRLESSEVRLESSCTELRPLREMRSGARKDMGMPDDEWVIADFS
jgi:hypothetical protein